ncbi:unnamed protein product [Rhizophagus irregularis]|nr:unnamed protein product [Rhizophagus irregularis]
MGISDFQGSEGSSKSGRKGETIDNGSDKRCSSDKKEIFRSGLHGYSLDKLSNEVIHPLVKPEELVEIVDNLRRDNQPRDPKKKDKDKKEQCIECLALKYVVTEKDVVDFINENSDI